jgi:hypothetical protein
MAAVPARAGAAGPSVLGTMARAVIMGWVQIVFVREVEGVVTIDETAISIPITLFG